MSATTPATTRATPRWIVIGFLACALVAVALAVPATPVAAAESNATITASPNEPGATATHRATAVVQSESAGDSLNKYRVDYTASSTPTDVSNVGQGDVVAVGLDTNGDGTIDRDVSSDLSSASASNDGHTLTFGFGGSYSLEAGDRLIVEFDDAVNPDAEGTFDVTQSINVQSDPVHTHTSGLTIDATEGSASITADPDTGNSTANHSVTRTVGSANDDTALTTVEVNYATAAHPADVSGVSTDDVNEARLDTDGDGEYETDLRPKLTGVTTSGGGETVTFEFDDSATLSTDDRVHLEFGGVTNPAEGGEYSVEVRLDSGRASPPTGTLAIVTGSETANAAVTASPTDPNATATHTATGTVGPKSDGDSLNGFTVDYTASSHPTDISDVGTENVVRVGLDTDGDGAIEENVADDLSEVSGSNDGHTLTFGFGGSYSLAEGDRIVVEFADAHNPDAAGSFDVDVVINPQSTGDAYTTGLTIGSDSTDDGSTDDGGDGRIAPSAAVEAQPGTGNATATHRIAAGVGTVDDGDSLTAVTIEYPVGETEADLGAVGLGSVTAGVDTDGDGAIETPLTDDLTAVRVGTNGELRISFDGRHTLADGETILVTVDDVHNPDAGDHEVTVEINPTATDSAVTTTLSTGGPGAIADDGIDDALLVADPPAAGANATHTARISLSGKLSLDRLTVNYPTAVDLAAVDEAELVRFGVDTDDDGDLDRSLQSAVESVETTGGSVTVHLRDGRTLGEGETVVVAVDEVRNPPLGDHSTGVRLNDRPAMSTPLLIGSETARTSTFQTDNGSRTIVQYPNDEAVVVDLSEVQRSGVGIERVRIRLANGTSQLVVGSGGKTYDAVDARGRRLAQLPVDHSDVAVSAANVEFSVAKSRLDGTDYGPENVSLYYREGDTWARGETELVGESADSYRFEASAASLSTYAVRLEPPNPWRQPAIEVGDVSLPKRTVERGEPARMHVAVRNEGNASGSRTVALTINGVLLEESTVSLAPDDATAVTFEHRFSRAGTYEVGVGDESVAVRVRSTNATESTATATSTSPSTASSGSVPGFGALTAVLALAFALTAGWLLAGRIRR